ncbi:YrrC family ATP-dependent DNA helicase [Piscibacillus salipiscarius]|uniref:YrrC family ATP-dependent DNA helicase n=1 Tax=Piscibacillus salipiscarius TaxID=299480 RepID=UPI003F71B751
MVMNTFFYGTLKTHPKFGEQYQVFTYEKEMPKDEDSLVKYFSSDLFYGIGEKTAKNCKHTRIKCCRSNTERRTGT